MHQNFLVENMTTLNENFIQRFQIYQAQFQAGLDSFTAQKMANTLLYKQMLQQANMGAFRDTFEFCAISCVVIIPLIFYVNHTNSIFGSLPKVLAFQPFP